MFSAARAVCGARFLSALLAAALLATGARAAGAQNLSCGTGDVEVTAVMFEGNHAFQSAVLEDGIVTTPSTFLQRRLGFWGTKNCLDKTEFPRDRFRLIIWYRNHGYASVTVDTIVTPAGKGKVAVRFSIHEGEPTIVDSLSFTGLDSVPERAALLRRLPLGEGKPFDRYAIDTTRDLLTQRLHNGGYPDAEVLVNTDTRPAARRASVSFAVDAGPRMRLGAVTVKLDPRKGASRVFTDRAVRRVASLREGSLYSQADLESAKRSLYQTDAFSGVRVVPDSTRTKGDSTLPVSLQVTEGYMHETHAGLGYGTLDCFRTTADFTKYSLFSGATRVDLHGKLSKIGVGDPLSGLGSLCPIAKSDLYSKNLNYYTGATFSRPAAFGGVVPSLSLYSERRSEFDAYLRTTPVGGNITLARPTGRVTEAFSYTVEYGRTEAQPALLCAVFNACEAADRDFVQRLQRLAVASVSVTHDASDSPTNPRHGTVLRLEFRTAGAFTGSDPSLHFNKVLADGSVYIPAGRDVTLAARIRLGAVLGSSFGFNNSAAFIPEQERLFAGGQTTVRGYQQNELGPAVYIPAKFDTLDASGGILHNKVLGVADTVYFRTNNTVSSQRTVPTGGNALAIGMLEARIRSPFLPELLEWALFVDAGALWNVGQPDQGISFGALRYTPGFGVRFHTGFGALRMDLAYNPYQPPAGPAYFDTPVQAGGDLFCVSPTNNLPVTVAVIKGVTQPPQQAAGACPGSYRPPLQTAWYRRFAFVLTLGEAF
jgi:outer membrane protein insertion porin family/translocation and assembly module TamA